MKIQLLVSAVNQDVPALTGQMHIQTDAVVVNQCDRYGYEEITDTGHRIQVFSTIPREKPARGGIALTNSLKNGMAYRGYSVMVTHLLWEQE